MTTELKSKSISNSTIHQVLAEVAAGVALRSLTKKYGAVTAVENLTLDITAGTYCCLLGPSGCGKTTVSSRGGFRAFMRL